MTDERLKTLYRQMTATRAADLSAIDADTVAQPLLQHGFADEEGTALDRVAASTLHADVLRTAAELGPDAADLSREITRLRAPVARPWAAAARRGLALAAGVGALAVLFATMRVDHATQPAAVQQQAQPEAEVILSASFETAPPRNQDASGQQSIFGAGFDS